MFDMIQKLIHKDLNVDVSSDPTNYEYFLSTMNSIFDNNEVEEIEDVNKILLDHNMDYFVNKYQKIQPINQDDFERLLQERELKLIDDNITMDIQEEVPTGFEPDTNVQPVHEYNKNLKKKKEKTIPDDDGLENISISINSSKRTNINSSRYNYKIDLLKHKTSTAELNTISKLIIPIEDNYLFSIPVLILNIPELDCSIHMQQDTVIDGNNRSYGVYQSIEKHIISKKKVDRITIDIRDISGEKHKVSDILKVNIIEIKRKKIYFTCSSIYKNDYEIGDYIKIINNNSVHIFNFLQHPLKIKKMQDNIIICEYKGIEEIEDKTYTNIDMKIMNMSNQNIIYFN